MTSYFTNQRLAESIVALLLERHKDKRNSRHGRRKYRSVGIPCERIITKQTGSPIVVPPVLKKEKREIEGKREQEGERGGRKSRKKEEGERGRKERGRKREEVGGR